MPITQAIYSKSLYTEKPLLLLLHGYGSNEHDLPGLAEIAFPDWDYVSLQAPHSLMGGFSAYAWFDDPVPAHSQRAPQADACTQDIIAFLEDAAKTGKIPAKRPLVLLGFSQGGAMVSYILQTGALKDRLVAAVNLSGYLPFEDGTAPQADACTTLKVFHGWGNADDVVPVHENKAARDWLAQHFANVEDHEYTGLAHSISLDEVRDLERFFASIAN